MKMSNKPHIISRVLPSGENKATSYSCEREARKYFAYMLYDNMYVKTKNEASRHATAIKVNEPYTVSNVIYTLVPQLTTT